jgi:uncharacterized cupredoxin-like copper-binding protein
VKARVAIAVALAGLAWAGVAAARLVHHPPSRLLVSGDEYSLVLSRGAVKGGPAVIQFMNRGEDPHDLRLRRVGASSARTVSAPEVRPGALVELETRLRAGRYRLWCSLPGHRARGMHAVLSVRR